MKETVYNLAAPVQLRLALVSDTHNVEPSPILASLGKNRPDLICVAGDLLIGKRPEGEGLIVEKQKNVLKLISGCAGIAPTYISLGNHEWMISPEDIEAISRAGAAVLDNEFAVISRDLLIGGLSSAIVTNFQQFRKEAGGRYPYRPRYSHPPHLDTDSAWLEAFELHEGYKILLCHYPEYWSLREPYLSEHPIDLVLSGHAHGGQIRLFGKGLFSHSQGWLPRYTKGIFPGKHGVLAVSAGLSGTARVPRIFNPPEVVYISLVGKNGD